MKTLLDAIDPLPRFGIHMQPWTKRRIEESKDSLDKAAGLDWRPAENPAFEVNGQGKLRTKDYKPPEPPEDDISFVIEWCESVLTTLRAEPTKPQDVWPFPTLEWVTDRITDWLTPDGRRIPLENGWYAHKPGDPMPCEPEAWVCWRVNNGNCTDYVERARNLDWYGELITAWKPA